MDVFGPTLEHVVSFLRNYDHGYLATADELWPEAVLVGFSANDLLEIMFGTDEISAKARNLTTNRRVGFTVTDAATRYQVKVRGRARMLDAAEYAKRRGSHYAKLVTSERFEREPGQVFYVIEPVWVKFRDTNPEHSRDWIEHEHTF